jgi:hypothetical protein
VDASTLKSFIAHPLVAMLGLLVAPVGFYHWTQSAFSQQDVREDAPSLLSARPAMAAPVLGLDQQTQLVKVPGVRPLEYHSVSVEGVLDTDPVIGVVIDGKPRAYLVNALCSLKKCVVNDVHAGRAISVMYAIESGSPRVLVESDAASSGATAPIELGIHGLVHRDLFLSHRGREVYFGGKIRGLRDFPYAHCSWGVWKNAYPETDLYTGDAAP